MPELPDLQVFSSNLDKTLKGKKVKKVSVPVTKKLNVTVAALKKKLEGQSIKKVYREGKELMIGFTSDTLSLHLMLHGNLYYFDDTNSNKHTIIEFLFADGKGLALTDWQKAATVTLNPEPKEAPDALSPDITFSFMKDVLQSKTVIKARLLDQKVIRGIGNAYADEILYDARISPFSISNKIPDDKIKALVKSIRKVLVNAEKHIRKQNPDRITGELRDFLPIHNSKKKVSPSGGEIRSGEVSSRKTYYTDEQELYS